MIRVIKLTLSILLASCLCGGCSGDDDEDLSNGDDSSQADEDASEPSPTCEGTWTITSATLDGAPYDTYGAVWVITADDWQLSTAICSSTGTTALDGENISMTVSSQNCADPVPAPEGRTASGSCSAVDGSMTMTLSHDLEGTTHVLTVTGQQ